MFIHYEVQPQNLGNVKYITVQHEFFDLQLQGIISQHITNINRETTLYNPQIITFTCTLSEQAQNDH